MNAPVNPKIRTPKAITRLATKLAKEATTVELRDKIADSLIYYYIDMFNKGYYASKLKEVANQWQLFVEYAGKLEIHDMYSFQINLTHILTVGLEGEVLGKRLTELDIITKGFVASDNYWIPLDDIMEKLYTPECEKQLIGEARALV